MDAIAIEVLWDLGLNEWECLSSTKSDMYARGRRVYPSRQHGKG